MHASITASIVGFAAAFLVLFPTAAAEAKCTRLAFSVNDYGKEGPTKDAKVLLDKYVAQWTAERGIKKYTTGKKDVSCELFLDVILFDEHTCKAAATVCWTDGAGGAAATAAPSSKNPANPPAAKPAKGKTAESKL